MSRSLTTHADVLTLLGGVALCSLVCAVAPAAGATTLAGVIGGDAGGFAGHLAPNVVAELFSKLAKRVKDGFYDPAESAKNHDLRELVVLAIENTVDESADGHPGGRAGLRRLRMFKAGVRERVEHAATDPRFAQL